ncbi:MAG: hypothetical protein LIP23_03605 [Planctomycetes bacterium]|nr:hypothetical protein [Planctomycetota bacterium]
MSSNFSTPADIMDAALLIKRLREKTYLSRAEREDMNRAKLKIAFWACRNENVVASRENLTYVLGADAAEIMGAYDRYLEREDEKSKTPAKKPDKDKKDKDSGNFWGGASR